jgi:predicted nicotinamide N-methyase
LVVAMTSSATGLDLDHLALALAALQEMSLWAYITPRPRRRHDHRLRRAATGPPWWFHAGASAGYLRDRVVQSRPGAVAGYLEE